MKNETAENNRRNHSVLRRNYKNQFSWKTLLCLREDFSIDQVLMLNTDFFKRIPTNKKLGNK
jgi:hypothetical protein